MKKPVCHPLLFTVFPILFLYASHKGDYPLDVLWVPLGTYLLTALIAWIFISFVSRNIEKGAIMVSLFMALYFSYGHIYYLLWNLFPGLRRLPLGVDLVLFPFDLLAFILLSTAIIRWKQDLTKVTRTLNVAAAALVGFSLVAVAFFAVRIAVRHQGVVQKR